MGTGVLECRACGKANASNRQYCGACGDCLVQHCQCCHFANGHEDKYCGGCAKELSLALKVEPSVANTEGSGRPKKQPKQRGALTPAQLASHLTEINTMVMPVMSLNLEDGEETASPEIGQEQIDALFDR